MSTSKQFKDFIIEQLSSIKGIECKPMMGEFLLYLNKVLVGGIYDNRFLVKQTNNNKKFNLLLDIPYKNGKPMFMIEDVDDFENLKLVILTTYHDLM